MIKETQLYKVELQSGNLITMLGTFLKQALRDNTRDVKSWTAINN
jgi:hypothetical protein